MLPEFSGLSRLFDLVGLFILRFFRAFALNWFIFGLCNLEVLGILFDFTFLCHFNSFVEDRVVEFMIMVIVANQCWSGVVLPSAILRPDSSVCLNLQGPNQSSIAALGYVCVFLQLKDKNLVNYSIAQKSTPSFHTVCSNRCRE